MSGSGSGTPSPTPASASAFLYVGLDDAYGSYGTPLPRTGHSSIAGFAIAADGSLQPTPQSPYTGPAELLAANASASAIYAASGTKINVDRVNADGSLTTTATLNSQPLGSNSTLGVYWDLSFDSGQQLLYALAAHGSGDGLWETYKSGNDGNLRAVDPMPTGPLAAHLYFTPDGKRAYSPDCYHLDGSIVGYTVGADNKLTIFNTNAPAVNFSFGPGCPLAMSVISDGTRLATQLNGKGGSGAAVAVYRINSDGTLTAQSGSPLLATAQGNDIAWDPLGRYFAVAAKDGLWIYSSSSESGPVAIGGAPVLAGPIDHLAFSKAGTLLFAVNASAQNLYVFNFDSTTGVATPAPGSPHKMSLVPYELVAVER